MGAPSFADGGAQIAGVTLQQCGGFTEAQSEADKDGRLHVPVGLIEKIRRVLWRTTDNAAVIPSKRNRKQPPEFDREVYDEQRHGSPPRSGERLLRRAERAALQWTMSIPFLLKVPNYLRPLQHAAPCAIRAAQL
jgi:hypothetical protein